MTKTNQNFEMWQGDGKTLVFSVTASTGIGQDLTGNTASWIIQDEEDSACLSGQVAGVVSGSLVNVILAASDTSGLCGFYYHELSLTASGSPVTAAIGTAKINRSSI